MNNPFNTLKSSKYGSYYSLSVLEEQKLADISQLPVSIRIMLESLLRNCDGKAVTEEDVLELANWNAKKPQDRDVPFIVARVVLQDFTGVPLLVDIAAMRDAVKERGFDPKIVEPVVPVDLVVDHSVQVDHARKADSFMFNVKLEFERNKERYTLLKWGRQAFDTFEVVPPGVGIVHQVNLEHLASVVIAKETDEGKVLYPDTLVGTDSHTTMINGLGIVGWGVGGIEAEAAMLGQPVAMQMPEVIGVHMSGKLKEGVTATDLTLRITEMLREENVVGKFVEYYGEGAASLSVADRATIGNMSPEYGATMGFFPVDEKSLQYLEMSGRSKEHIEMVKDYLSDQKLFGIPRKGEVNYTKSLDLDLDSVQPSVSGPKRPQDRILISELKEKFKTLFTAPLNERGYAKSADEYDKKVEVQTKGTFVPEKDHDTGGTEKLGAKEGWSEEEMVTNRPFNEAVSNPGYIMEPVKGPLGHGSVVIAAITSCTNTSNPSVMIGAGLLAKKAVEKGMKVHPFVKTSLAPGSRVVTDYLEKTDLQQYLDALGFNLVAYGCTTCIGNSGPLDETIENTIKEHDLITASVLSGNRNFEARIHSSVKANFLMSPPLVVAYALAGRIDLDLDKDPIGVDKEGKQVFLKDIWPSSKEIHQAIEKSIGPEMFEKRYANVLKESPVWNDIEAISGDVYPWDDKSTYIQKPPYFEGFDLSLPPRKSFAGMRPLAFLGDSVTTDHISPAGAFREDSPAGKYLTAHGVERKDFNSYGSRRGNHDVMMRGTFGNVRIQNKLADGKEGGYTKLMPEGKIMPIFDACEIYAQKNVPLIVFAGKDYGMGSSRDWAAKGSQLLGVTAVVAESFERIHRSNLIGMGVLPLQFQPGENLDSLKLTGEETFTLSLEEKLTPRQEVALEIDHNGQKRTVTFLTCLNTPTEIDYYEHGGIMPYVLRKLLEKQK